MCVGAIGRSAALETRLTLTHACTRSRLVRLREDGRERIEARGLPLQVGGARFEALVKYASPRPRTCTSRVLKPCSRAVRTSVAIDSGELERRSQDPEGARFAGAVAREAACGEGGRGKASAAPGAHRRGDRKPRRSW